MDSLAIFFASAVGIGLLLAVVQFLIWLRLRARPEFLFAAIMSAAAGLTAICERGMLGTVTPVRIQTALEIQNAAVAATLIAMVWFVWFRLGTGRKWLAIAITVSWSICVAISLIGPGNIAFSAVETVTSLRTPWGEVYSVPQGTIHPLKFITDLTSLAILIFTIDASLSAFRSGKRRSALLVGGPILFFILVAGIHTPLVDAGVIQTPYIISLVFVAISASLAIGLVDDVARAALLTRQLEVERQRWLMLLDRIDLAVVRIAPDGTIAYVNPHLEQLSGRSASDLLGRNPIILSGSYVDSNVKQILSTTSDWITQSRVHHRLRTATGATRDLIWFGVALRDENGNPDGVISFGQDITDQIAAETARDQTEREIEKLSRALTMGELASTFAHELSQPIAAVLSNAQTLQMLRNRRDAGEGDETEILGDILRDTRRARDIMKRVREFMFNEAPQQSTFELGEMIGDSLEMMSPEARASHVSVEAEGPGNEIWVHAARLELQQVVLNLVLNAIQAVGRDGSGKVQVVWRRAADALVEIQIDDNGPGISDEKIATVFRPFISSKSKGTGIGLAVVRRVAERHEGTVRVTRNDHGGARFLLKLPISAPGQERAVG